MKHSVALTLAVVAGLFVFGEGRALAQPRPGIGQTPITQPPYSPYLNLLRGGSLTQNYWGLVQPELQWRGSVQGLEQQVSANTQAISSLQVAQGPPATGHTTRFLSTGGYFLRSTGVGVRPGR
jgi:hypothetical protein